MSSDASDVVLAGATRAAPARVVAETASLSTAVNAVKGLIREEIVECLVSPLREPSDFLSAFEDLEKVAWYVHHTPEGRYYFDRQENLTKLLRFFADGAAKKWPPRGSLKGTAAFL